MKSLLRKNGNGALRRRKRKWANFVERSANMNKNYSVGEQVWHFWGTELQDRADWWVGHSQGSILVIWGVQAPRPPNVQLPPKKMLLSLQYIGNSSEKSARRDEVSAHTGTFLIIVSQNVSDCISPHTHLKKFPGKQVSPPPLPGSSWPSATRDFSPSGLLPPNDKS